MLRLTGMTELSQERIKDLLELQAKLFELASNHGI